MSKSSPPGPGRFCCYPFSPFSFSDTLSIHPPPHRTCILLLLELATHPSKGKIKYANASAKITKYKLELRALQTRLASAQTSAKWGKAVAVAAKLGDAGQGRRQAHASKSADDDDDGMDACTRAAADSVIGLPPAERYKACVASLNAVSLDEKLALAQACRTTRTLFFLSLSRSLARSCAHFLALSLSRSRSLARSLA
eukprot:1005015-Pleurochrysis_carterae.AAC.1